MLQWKEHSGVDISSEVKMPQFEISRVAPSKCQENFHIGEECLRGGLVQDVPEKGLTYFWCSPTVKISKHKENSDTRYIPTV